jgi:16S rRNA processing protein RimM
VTQSGGQPVLLGKVTAPHGLKGGLRVVVYSGETGNLSSLDSIMLKGTDGELETFALERVTVHGKKVFITLRGYGDINKVAHLLGRELYARRNQLPELLPGEYYWYDLIGLQVVTSEGESLGQLSEIIATGSNDVYVVTGEGREYLIPALEDVVLEINPAAGRMMVTMPEGLLDL